ncbi:unnamed protein product [Pleuronectes platessa]|uniref:Uncharacterized protein n=1 Tax=Pleuronectes platessa TaxID=8262 RepID=A0A9N7Y6K5_PLEPL|nr:unnamed protein product [Pleuronectes platessa]
MMGREEYGEGKELLRIQSLPPHHRSMVEKPPPLGAVAEGTRPESLPLTLVPGPLQPVPAFRTADGHRAAAQEKRERPPHQQRREAPPDEDLPPKNSDFDNQRQCSDSYNPSSTPISSSPEKNIHHLFRIPMTTDHGLRWQLTA